ncbi:MAG: aminoacetone oxidase family FAD-binding enzyme [candidate division SR1 bacterium]|nr:aminoacetone oxidase family FAD-binding enzyme [candidate division SR1 bacterium]
MQMYDVVVIGGGASGLFCSLFLPKEIKKCIIEKTDKLASKVLLSGGERCNLTNSNLDPELYYIGQSLKSLPSLFHAFGPEDMIQYLHEHAIETKIEENGRVLLKSGKAKQLVDFLVDESKKNETEFLLSHDVHSITTADYHTFVVTTSAGIYSAKQVIIATGGMTYPQIGASPFAYEIAEQLGLPLSSPHAALCGIETKEDVSLLAGNTVQAMVTLYADNKIVYKNTGSVLFTHIGLSGPVIFDATLYIDQDISEYSLQCDFDLASTSKKVIQFFKLVSGDTLRDISIKALRPMTEAKISVGGILLKELDQHFQSKKIPGLYFIGESLDITGKTGGYNLQRAWTSAYVCAKDF